MTKGDFFILCVQTCVLKDPMSPGMALSVLRGAARVPEEAIGTNDVATAAGEFAQWARNGSPKGKEPKWLEAWYEGQRNRCIVRVNDNPDATRWWLQAEDEFRRLLDSISEMGGELPFPQECGALLLGRVREVEVARDGAERFKRWVDRIPGNEEEPFSYEYPGEQT